jgi:hypothetical protein
MLKYIQKLSNRNVLFEKTASREAELRKEEEESLKTSEESRLKALNDAKLIQIDLNNNAKMLGERVARQLIEEHEAGLHEEALSTEELCEKHIQEDIEAIRVLLKEFEKDGLLVK